MKKVGFGGVYINGYQITNTIRRNTISILSNATKNGQKFIIKFTKGYDELYYIDNFYCDTILKPIEHFFSRNYYVSVFDPFTFDLYDFISFHNIIPLEISLKIIEDCFSALYYLHCSCSVLHNNIKLENVLIYDNGNGTYSTKLCDFQGAVILNDDEKCFSNYGTPGYFPPEYYLNIGRSYYSDVYSLGVTLRYLWYRTDKNSKNQQFVDSMSELLGQMVNEEPSKRPTAQECYSKIYYSKIQ
ncbi:hypothetical protein TRFO_25915 [Tritrichomonas foetus]|uniref:Protein kinase domain-containing protein n=1 Tax=Tritrichomonas foetus TaxID=1144522 RepID=A0A1J4K424_9EUKA|nr:hypothetical protein TRFO_25915 [Tritrichomonas foetus]|eukprot:OHT06135.1 hypothetical protein TRFO_25915 [Tritrichomonas foetus]